MNTPFEIDRSENRIVYVRSVKAEDLPEEIRAQVGDGPLYAVHNGEDGERLALVRDRNLAFALARQNDLAPVTVH